MKIGPKTTMLLGEMTLPQLTDLMNAYRHSRSPNAATLRRLLGAEINIRRRVFRQRIITVDLEHA